MSSYKQQTSKHQQRLSQIQHGVTVSLHHLGARTRARPMAVLAAYRKASSRAFGSSYSKSSSPKFVINLHQISKFNKKQSPKKKWTPPPTPPHPNPQPPSLTSPTHRLRRLLRRLARVRRLLNRQRRGAGAGHGNALRQAVAVSGLGAAPGGGQNDQKINI